MTREELKAHCEKQIEMCEIQAIRMNEKPSGKIYEEHKLILELLEQQPCEDCISKQKVIEILDSNIEWMYKGRPYAKLSERNQRTIDVNQTIKGQIIRLPLVTPKPKTGHWRQYEGMLICSECGAEFYDDIMEYCGDGVPKCCPNCGAKMQEVEEI